MKTAIIYLEEHDDIISVLDKMDWSNAARILLVMQRDKNIIDQRLDLVCIQRRANHLGAQLALVTRDVKTIEFAEDCQIPLFSTVYEAQRSSWRRFNWKKRGPQVKGQSLFRTSKLFEKEKPARWDESLRAWYRLPIFLIAILFVLAVGLSIAPAVTVWVETPKERQSIDIEIKGDAKIEQAMISGEIPIQPVQVEISQKGTIDSSAKIDIPDQISKGNVIFTNLIDQPLDIPKETVVLATFSNQEVIRFKTSENATIVSGLQKVTVPVTAVLPGIAGNIEAGEITSVEGQIGLNVSVTNSEPFVGGSNRQVSSPSQADYEKLRAEILASLQKRALTEMELKALPNEKIIPDSINLLEVKNEDREPQEGQPGDVLKLEIKAQYGAYSYRETDIQEVIQQVFASTIKEGWKASEGSLFTDIVYLESSGVKSPRWKVGAEREIYQTLDRGKIAELITNMSESEASERVKKFLGEATVTTYTHWPVWFTRMPFYVFRIMVREK